LNISKLRVLVIGIWGDPSRWSQVEYRIHIPSISVTGIQSIAKDVYGGDEWSISTHSTTLALACFFKSFADVKIVIFGLDSLADLGDPICRTSEGIKGADVRECARKRYEFFLERFVNSIDRDVCKLDNYEQFIEVVVAPARGSFYGYRFSGSPVHIFNKAFIKILNVVEEFNPRFVVLDVTHGVNYQTISVQYAALAVNQLVNALNKLKGRHQISLVIMNSEPIPSPQPRSSMDVGSREGSEKRLQDPVPQLKILDVSEIAATLEFVNNLRSVLSFRLPSSRVIIEKGFPEEAREVLQKLVAFIKIIESSAVSLTYPGSIDETGKPLDLDICSTSLSIQPLDTEYVPLEVVVDEVRYEKSSITPVLLYALSKATSSLQQDLCAEFVKKYLDRYLEKLGSLLQIAELSYAHKLISSEKSSWDNVRKTVGRLIKECWSELESVAKEKSKEEAIHTIIARGSGENVVVTRDMLASLRDIERDVIERESCRDLVETVVNKFRYRESVCSVSDKMMRNMIAHAGLSYDFIERIELARDRDEYRVSRVVYRRCLVEEFLNQLLEFKKFKR
jgi:CRISPR-associated protein Csx1